VQETYKFHDKFTLSGSHLIVIYLCEIPQIYNTWLAVFGYTEKCIDKSNLRGMVMIKRVIMCVICLMLLSACDTGGGNTSSATENDNLGRPYVPIDLDTINEGSSGMIMSGAIDHNTGHVDAFLIRKGNRFESHNNLEIESRNGYLLRLTLYSGLSEGTYPINTTLDTTPTEAEIAGGLLYLWSPDEAQQFIRNPQGSLTLTFQEDEILGSFTMTAENLAGESVSIEGQFYAKESTSAVREN
jgi:hypothetical protein